MSIDLTILSDPKIKKLFAESLLARRAEIMEDVLIIDATLTGIGVDVPNPIDAPQFKTERRTEASKNGKRMRKGEAEKLIVRVLSANPHSRNPLQGIAGMVGIPSSTAWRALRRLDSQGKVIQHEDKSFQWKTDLPVASGNGKGAET